MDRPMYRVWFRVPGIFWHEWYFVCATNLVNCQRVLEEIKKSDIPLRADCAAIWECHDFFAKLILSERQLKKIGKIHTLVSFNAKS